MHSPQLHPGHTSAIIPCHSQNPSRLYASTPLSHPNKRSALDYATPSSDASCSGSDQAAAAPTAFSRRGLGAAAAAAAASGVVLTPADASAAATAVESTIAAPTPAAGRIHEVRMVVRVTALRGVPQQWVSDFGAALEGYGVVAMTQRAQLADIWQDLGGPAGTGKGGKKGKAPKAPTTVDAVSLGDAWLQPAISHGLLQPIAGAKDQRWWTSLPPRFRQLVTRGPSGLPDPKGEVWAAPYRWGCTLLLCRSDRLQRLGGPITDWDDLLRPELKGRVGFIDSPRELVGVALKTLGLSYAAGPRELAGCGVSEEELAARVRALAQQVRVFSNLDHVRALSADEVDVVVGWSDDLVSLAERQNNAQLVAPLSGTALWADAWCIPAHAAGGAEDGEPSPLLPAWFELPLQPVRAQRAKGLKGGASPLLLPPLPNGKGAECLPVRGALSGSSQLVGGVMPGQEVLQRSEFLMPLPPSTAAMYRRVLGL